MPRHRAVVLGLLVAALGLTGCGGTSTPAPTAAPSAVPLRAIAACAAGVVVPTETTATVLDASAPPTVSLAVGSSVSFVVPAGARLGIVGAADPDADATLCASSSPGSADTVLIAIAEGYLRVGAQVGTAPVAQVLVKVTPA